MNLIVYRKSEPARVENNQLYKRWPEQRLLTVWKVLVPPFIQPVPHGDQLHGVEEYLNPLKLLRKYLNYLNTTFQNYGIYMHNLKGKIIQEVYKSKDN